MSNTYSVYNGPMVTTAAPAPVTTGTSIKTMLQLVPAVPIKVVEWGYSLDAAPTTPGTVELIHTGIVAATVTAYVAADITKFDADALLGGDPTTALIAVGTTSSGYTSTSEGSITAVRNLAVLIEDGWRDPHPANQRAVRFALIRAIH